jgi:hypothetical protein
MYELNFKEEINKKIDKNIILIYELKKTLANSEKMML